jgi:drug/metabolite transporter (DMT)-like permease
LFRKYHMPFDTRMQAALLIVGAELMFASMGATIKAVAVELPNEVIVFFRNFAGLMVLLPWLVHHGLRELVTRQLRFHLLRGIAGLGAMYCFFFSLAHMRLAEATLLALTSPFFIPGIAFVWLREPVPLRVLMAIVVGFIGVVCILQPGLAGVTAVAPIALLGAALAALAKVTVRRLSGTESSAAIVFYFGLLSTLLSAFLLPWSWATPTPKAFVQLVALGIFATAGQLLMTRAFALVPAAQLGPFTYVAVVFAGFYGWWWWEEPIQAPMILGALLIATAGVIAGSSQAEFRRQDRAQRKTPLQAGSKRSYQSIAGS